MMAPYDENMEAEPRFEALDESDLAHLAEQAGSNDINVMVRLVEDWIGNPGAIVDGVLGYMSTYNPQSKWDYWRIGGRWAGAFISHDPEAVMMPLEWEFDPKYNEGRVHELVAGQCDQSRKCYIDWDAMGALQVAELRKQWAEIQAFPRPVSLMHGIQPGDDEESYVRRGVGFSTFAVLNADGWHERGRMGWFGMTSDEKDDWPDTFKALVDAADGDAWFSVLDIHI